MLSYQHGYHAGGPADLHKHAALCAVLERLAEKAKPFVVIDLYAGHGAYGLGTPEAQKTREFESGIGRVWPTQQSVPPAIGRLFDAVSSLNPEGRLVRYPGSPALTRAALRADDRLILNELHPGAFADLRRWAGRDARISLHKRDGLEALLGLTPPPIRRGLVVIDPSYEVKTEYESVPQVLTAALRKWKEGIYLLWYPIMSDGRHRKLLDGLEASARAASETLVCELTFKKAPGKDAPGLAGTGLAVINPPYRFAEMMAEAGDWLARALVARHSIRPLAKS